MAFEDGDPERPLILGSLWNGVQQAPRYDFRGGDIEPNNVKRLVTKSGNRLHLSDKPGQETVFLATPKFNSLSMTRPADSLCICTLTATSSSPQADACTSRASSSREK